MVCCSLYFCTEFTPFIHYATLMIMTIASCDSVQKLKIRLKALTHESQTKWSLNTVKKFTSFVFRFLKDSPQSRSIDISIACKMLKNVLDKCIQSPFTDNFIRFLRDNSAKYRCINFDQWKIFVDFSRSVRTDFSNFDSSDAWPILYDSFVEWSIESK